MYSQEHYGYTMEEFLYQMVKQSVKRLSIMPQ